MKAKVGPTLCLLLGGLSLITLATGCLDSGPLLQPWNGNGYSETTSIRPRSESINQGPITPAYASVSTNKRPMSGGSIIPVSASSAAAEPAVEFPTEKLKVTFPAYVIEIPDVLLVDLIHGSPKPVVVQPGDNLVISCSQAPKDEPVQGVYPINPDGTVVLGFNYGSVFVANVTVDQAREVIRRQLSTVLPKAQPTVALAQASESQQLKRERVVRPDGTISLGPYGSVYVVGLTLDNAKQTIERQLAKKLIKPEVSVDVATYKSKFYYLILNGAGIGEKVMRFPASGNETVLDAMTEVSGIPASYRMKVWVARPAPPHSNFPDQILPVDWYAVTQGGNTKTNYQLLPGDRVYVSFN